MPDFRHFTLTGTRSERNYTAPSSGGGEHSSPPRPDRITHGEKLLADLDRAVRTAQTRQKSEPCREGLQFIPMRFAENSELNLKLQSLAGNERSGIRILSARESGAVKEYLVAVPDSKVVGLAKKFQDYRDEDTDKGRPKNEDFAVSVASIEAGELADYWTEPDGSLPHREETLWWEVWLSSHRGDDVEAWFRQITAEKQILISHQRVRFPDRLVILAYTTLGEWETFPGLLQHLAEFRRAKLVASEFTCLNPAGQAEYVQDLLSRIRFSADDATRICLLDTGVDRGHPLLESSLSPADSQTWREEWGTADHNGHGTELAGLCLFGSLGGPLYDGGDVELRHRLESVKILPPRGRNEPPDYGPITVGAMAMAEANAPHNSRVFCLAVSAEGDDHWRPTLWSAAIDQACAGALDGQRRLLVVSTGNLRTEIGKNYPQENHVSSIEEPGQAWNALTVGASTDLAWLNEEGLEGYSPIARPGSLSPTSRTSLCWDPKWPYKPDVVFEGGNYARDAKGFVIHAEDLELLTTVSRKGTTALLGTTRDSSAAAAQVARMAAILQADYLEFWPETIRGLIVHSAEWTPQMRAEFPYRERKQRLRVYGMGVPRLSQARRSARGVATMVIQDELQPYRLTNGDNHTHEMHLHDLPFPREVLEELGNVPVRMRVTLSYFIEPNPPRRGYVARYQYASHGLRFSVRRPQETVERMVARLTTTDWPLEQTRKKRPFQTVPDDRSWDLGPESVSVRGSIHSDAWQGTAAELASSNLIAVFPVNGWWRYLKDRDLVEKRARYSLIVTISTTDTSIDFYGMVENEITTRIKTDVVTEIPLE
jgi:hypothetical protein